MSMPMGTETFGAPIATIHTHHEETKFPCQKQLFQAASVTGFVPTPVPAPCPTSHHRFVGNQSHQLPQDYQGTILSSGCIAQDHPPGKANFVAKQSYPSSHGYGHSGLVPSGHASQNPTYGHMNHGISPSTPFATSYTISLANQKDSVDYRADCDLCIKQSHFRAHDNRYGYDYQHFSEGKSIPSEKLSQQDIPVYTEVPEYEGNTVPAIHQQKNGSGDYIPVPDCDEHCEKDPTRHGIHGSDDSGSSGLENDIGANMSDLQHSEKFTGAESNGNVLCSCCPRSGIFSRLSQRQPPLPQAQQATYPSLSQLVSSLSEKAVQWNNNWNGPFADGASKHFIREEAAYRSFSHSELNQPVQLKFEVETETDFFTEAGEGTEPEPPFLNFKRRSGALQADAEPGKEISGNVKRRKLVRPSFGTNIDSTNEKQEEGNFIQEKKHMEVGGNHCDIDLNICASVVNDPAEEDNGIAVHPSVLINTQKEKVLDSEANKPNCSNLTQKIKEQDPSFDNAAPGQKVSTDFDNDPAEEDNSIAGYPSVLIDTQKEKVLELEANKPNCPNLTETTKEQDPSFDNAAPAQSVSFDFDMAELDTMDESRLRAILGQASFLLQALTKRASGKL